MIEIPSKTPATYRTMFKDLSATAQKYNDTEADLAPEDKDVVILEMSSQGLYSSGEEVRMEANLAKQSLSVVRKNTKRRPFKATIEMTDNGSEITSKETLHDRKGLVERSFVITGDQVEVLSEESDPSNRYDPSKTPGNKEVARELDSATDTLQYLIGPGFQG